MADIRQPISELDRRAVPYQNRTTREQITDKNATSESFRCLKQTSRTKHRMEYQHGLTTNSRNFTTRQCVIEDRPTHFP